MNFGLKLSFIKEKKNGTEVWTLPLKRSFKPNLKLNFSFKTKLIWIIQFKPHLCNAFR